jgi:hypothetical protein
LSAGLTSDEAQQVSNYFLRSSRSKQNKLERFARGKFFGALFNICR